MRGMKPVAKIVAAESTCSRKALAGSYAKDVHWDDDSGFGFMVDGLLLLP